MKFILWKMFDMHAFIKADPVQRADSISFTRPAQHSQEPLQYMLPNKYDGYI